MILRGLWLLARGRVAGIAEFANSDDALTASLAPLIAFPLVGAGRTALLGQPELALLSFLARLCAVLALPLITYQFARFTGKEDLWRRTVSALDWSFWMIVPLLIGAAFIGALLVKLGLPLQNAEYVAFAVILVYGAWLHWFIVRIGLQLGRWQAALLVILNSAAIGLLTDGPFIFADILHLKIV